MFKTLLKIHLKILKITIQIYSWISWKLTFKTPLKFGFICLLFFLKNTRKKAFQIPLNIQILEAQLFLKIHVIYLELNLQSSFKIRFLRPSNFLQNFTKKGSKNPLKIQVQRSQIGTSKVFFLNHFKSIFLRS